MQFHYLGQYKAKFGNLNVKGSLKSNGLWKLFLLFEDRFFPYTLQNFIKAF